MCHQLMSPKPPSLLNHLSRHEVGITVHFGKIMVDVAERILQDMRLQIPGPPLQLETLVDKLLTVAHPAFSEQLGLAIIGVPAAVANPAPQEIIPPRHEVRVGLRAAFERPADFVSDFRCSPLVRVQTENPVMRRMRHRLVSQLSESLELMLEHLVGKLPTDLLSRISAM